MSQPTKECKPGNNLLKAQENVLPKSNILKRAMEPCAKGTLRELKNQNAKTRSNRGTFYYKDLANQISIQSRDHKPSLKTTACRKKLTTLKQPL